MYKIRQLIKKYFNQGDFYTAVYSIQIFSFFACFPIVGTTYIHVPLSPFQGLREAFSLQVLIFPALLIKKKTLFLTSPFDCFIFIIDFHIKNWINMIIINVENFVYFRNINFLKWNTRFTDIGFVTFYYTTNWKKRKKKKNFF